MMALFSLLSFRLPRLTLPPAQTTRRYAAAFPEVFLKPLRFRGLRPLRIYLQVTELPLAHLSPALARGGRMYMSWLTELG